VGAPRDYSKRPGSEIRDWPLALTSDRGGNIFYTGFESSRVLRLDKKTGEISVYAGTGEFGFSGDGGAAINAKLEGIRDLVFDDLGNLYIGSEGRVRRIDSAGVITTIAGCCEPAIQQGLPPTGDGGAATEALINSNPGVTIGNGKLYLFGTDYPSISAGWIRAVDLSTGLITRIAGNGVWDVSPKIAERANQSPMSGGLGFTSDASGRLFYSTSHLIVRVDPQSNETAWIAGSGRRAGFSGDGGSALNATLNRPTGMSFDSRGNLYFADAASNRVRVILCAGSPAPGAMSDCDPTIPLVDRKRVLVRWNIPDAERCESEGAWSGIRGPRGAEWWPIAAAGQPFKLLCLLRDGKSSRFETSLGNSASRQITLSSTDSKVISPERTMDTDSNLEPLISIEGRGGSLGIASLGSENYGTSLSARGESVSAGDLASSIELDYSQARYEVIRAEGGVEESQKWSVRLVDSIGNILASQSLPNTPRVMWRREGGAGVLLSTSAIVQFCANRVWVVQDGYQLMAHTSSDQLASLQTHSISMDSGAYMMIATMLRCQGQDLAVEGILNPVSSSEPRLRVGASPATKVSLVVSRDGAVSELRLAESNFDLQAWCRTPSSSERLICQDVRSLMAE
jgi:hypothetical protein